jgi:hypothetical protein
MSVSLDQNEDTIIESDAAAFVEAAASSGIGEGHHPEQGVIFAIAAI